MKRWQVWTVCSIVDFATGRRTDWEAAEDRTYWTRWGAGLHVPPDKLVGVGTTRMVAWSEVRPVS